MNTQYYKLIDPTIIQLITGSLMHVAYITDEGIRAVARGLPQLQSLDIGFCVNITDEGWLKKEKIILNKYRTI